MNPLARQELHDRIFNAVQLLLAVSDRNYLRSLSRSTFLDALENELRFLGFYAASDEETLHAVHAFLDRHVDQWQLDIKQVQAAAFTELQSLQERRVQMPTSPLLYNIENSSSILSLMKTTHFFGSIPLQHMNIQTGNNAP
jgi:hypothetical protein